MSNFRSVLDTNVVLAGKRTAHPSSPNREIIERWLLGEFTLLYSLDLLHEYAEKLTEHGIPDSEIEEFFRAFGRLAEEVWIESFHLRHYPVDADDIAFLLCALNGAASHLVTYDDHLLTMEEEFRSAVRICKPVAFLADLRTGS
jgi:predicted nucleic acid-binding protein